MLRDYRLLLSASSMGGMIVEKFNRKSKLQRTLNKSSDTQFNKCEAITSNEWTFQV